MLSSPSYVKPRINSRSISMKRLPAFTTCIVQAAAADINAAETRIPHNSKQDSLSITKNNIVSCSTGSNSRNTRATVPSLPQEIIFNILLLLPAQCLYDVMRHVCRQWHNIIHHHTFISAHLARSSTGLLMREDRNRKRQTLEFVHMSEGGLKFTKLQFPIPCFISSSCNGLVLMVEKNKRTSTSETKSYNVYHVVNPVTKKRWTLPPLHKHPITFSRSGISYDASNQKYKVVQCYNSTGKRKIVSITILTVGVDKAWRQIDTKHISDSLLKLLLSTPKCSGGTVYWTGHYTSAILALDVATEIVHQTPMPAEYNKDLICRFEVMGSSLCLMSGRNMFLWEVWELRGSNNSYREWIKLHNIEIDGGNPILKLCQMLGKRFSGEFALYPVKWMRNEELMMFKPNSSEETCIIFDIQTGEMTSYQKERKTNYLNSLHHVCSLVSLDVC